jgi:hypothetical protein
MTRQNNDGPDKSHDRVNEKHEQRNEAAERLSSIAGDLLGEKQGMAAADKQAMGQERQAIQDFVSGKTSLADQDATFKEQFEAAKMQPSPEALKRMLTDNTQDLQKVQAAVRGLTNLIEKETALVSLG